jgi:hypothetical protein
VSTEERAQPCPVCGTPAAVTVAKFGDYKDVNCPRCGEFMVSGTAATLSASMPRDTRRGHLAVAQRWVEPGDKPFVRNV